MSLSITGRNVEITPAIREYVENKIGRVGKHFDSVIGIQVVLSVERVQHKAEVTLRLAGKDLHSEAAEESMYAAIDVLADKVERQIIKAKDKVGNHAHTPHKRMESASL
ncbi:ribosome-associated translation inhibitor RaiA [Alcaligenaceae bacterium 429]|uniref:ribosome hibernation-promoting factor, HPF/YfiA family n=1 Tax=unclassified Paenalcaligenes TaxID=2685726 RepID=UPI001093127C|nr:ribosome-associated translation inhibitor RaiA [Alcaligenaceae bacterium 429]